MPKNRRLDSVCTDRSEPLRCLASAGITMPIVDCVDISRESTSHCEDRTDAFLAQSSHERAVAEGVNGDVLTRVRLFLSACSVPALRRIRADQQGDAIVLKGQVHTFYEKQVATECARRVAGVIRVVNLIDVPARMLSSEGV